jgi:hypothetical protein
MEVIIMSDGSSFRRFGPLGPNETGVGDAAQDKSNHTDQEQYAGLQRFRRQGDGISEANGASERNKRNVHALFKFLNFAKNQKR